jgi:hypothetical protein
MSLKTTRIYLFLGIPKHYTVKKCLRMSWYHLANNYYRYIDD